jgi:hypothetical protein
MTLENQFFALRQRKESIEKELDQVKDEIGAVEQQLLLWLENNNLTQIKGPNGTLFLRDEVYARIEDADTAFAWLEEHDMSDVIKRTVHAKTLSSIAKDQGEFPGIKVSLVTKIGFRKAGGKE